MIALTAASGGLGYATLLHLLSTGRPVVAIVRDPERLRTRLDAETTDLSELIIRQADYNDPGSLDDALRGVTHLLQVSASDIGEQAERQESNVVEAACRQGVRHMVYTSTLHPEYDAHFQSAVQCRRTEDQIRQSGMTYTFFRNSMYFETLPLFIGAGWEEGTILLPVGGGKVSFVSREDIAEALARVLVSSGYENQAYNITGEEAFTFADVADLLTALRQRPFRFTDLSADAWKAALPEGMMPEEMADWFLSMLTGIRYQEFSTVSDSLQTLLNRPRRTLSSYLRHV
ncbi:SDR family oxidoreductase [Siphonobacter aquaeclarae]|uniref:NAD(P)H dehydrogenase (Quinone) n=1 Tax=Siphonobacter aquaeclarae TaxID=563176 RepID=A0A1G9HZF5_9BACT|nr:SDR family oxidoreductase [Siphonobacter aquaeclarae]SDL18377.1 NAD(P)H dehydrogenase (quinone) [Siphonobacter aquaeclarae]